jgi:hypothetical protein
VNPMYAAGKDIFKLLEMQGLEGCLIGGLAVARWGEPRLTRHIDLTVLAEIGSEEKIVDILLQQFAPRLEEVRDFALRNRVVLLRANNGVDIDIALGATSFEIESVRRANPFEFEAGCVLRTCTAEDLIIYKAFAGRPQDVADIRGIVFRQFAKLDLNRIRRWLKIFIEAKGDLDLARPFEEALRSAEIFDKRRK